MASSSPHRVLLVLVAILLGVVVALVAGILLAIGGMRLTPVILGSGAAFATTVPLVLLIERELGLFASSGP
jgi:hypothetical protein